MKDLYYRYTLYSLYFTLFESVDNYGHAVQRREALVCSPSFADAYSFDPSYTSQALDLRVLASQLILAALKQGYKVFINHRINRKTLVPIYIPEIKLAILFPDTEYSYKFNSRSRQKINKKAQNFVVYMTSPSRPQKKHPYWISPEKLMEKICK